MAKTVGKLVTVLTANAAPFRREMRRSENRLERFGRRAGRVAKELRVIGTAGLAAAASSALFIQSTAQENDRLAKFAQRLGVSAKSLARLQFVAKLTGVEVNQLNTGIQRMTRRVAEAAAGTGEAQDAIKELGLDAATLNALPIEEKMVVLARALGMVQNEADRVRLTFKLFDSEGVGLKNTLAALDGQGEELFREFDRLRSVSEETLGSSESLEDSFTRLGTAWQGFKTSIADTGPLKVMVDLLTDALAVSSKFVDVVDKFKASFAVGKFIQGGGEGGVTAAGMTEFLSSIRRGEINRPLPDPNLNAVLDQLQQQTELMKRPPPMVLKMEP